MAPSAQRKAATRKSAKKASRKISSQRATKKASKNNQQQKAKKPSAKKSAKQPAKQLAPKAVAKSAPAARRTTKPISKPPKLDMSSDVMEFITAIDAYRKEYHRPFPGWSEILFVVKNLGYKKSGG